MCVMKGIVRYAVIAGLVGGAAALIAGPERLSALFSQTRQKINAHIDAQIDDPVALRSQLKTLEQEYPQRIEAVRKDLAEVQAQQAQLKRELQVSERVVDLARNDADQIQDLISRGESAQVSSAADGRAKLVRVVFANETLNLQDAYAKANQVRQVHNAYVTRVQDIEKDLSYLSQQEDRLTKLAEQIQGEYADFQTQVWQLDRQVDTISRNDRLISMMEKREKTISEQSRYSAGSLEQVQGRFADIRARQDARLKTLGTASSTSNYEDRAKFDLDGRKGDALTPLKELPTKPAVIEIRPDDATPRTTNSKV